jgi:hypothetical protein
MTGNLLDKYVARSNGDTALADDSQVVVEDLGSFGWLRGVQDRAIMLEIRHKDRRISAFGYTWLDHVEFDPSEGITLHFSGKTVKIAGRNLNVEFRENVRLLGGILRHRVPWIQETDGADVLDAPKDTVVIEEVTVT